MFWKYCEGLTQFKQASSNQYCNKIMAVIPAHILAGENFPVFQLSTKLFNSFKAAIELKHLH